MKRYLCILTGVLALLGVPANSQDSVLSARENMMTAIASVDGSVDVIVLAEPEDAQWLATVVDSLRVSPADQVRFSVGYDVPGKRDLHAMFEASRPENGPAWHVCRNWFLDPDHGDMANRLAPELGGGVLFIDTGSTSEIVDNPNASFDEAMAQDPVFKGVFGTTARVSDGVEYQDAVTLVWVQVPQEAYNADRLKRGGFMDGC